MHTSKKIRYLFILHLLVLLISIGTHAQGTLHYPTLKDVRQQLTVQELTLDERNLTLDQLQIDFSKIYVHRELKIKKYGREADVVARADDLRKQAPHMTSEQFHYGIVDILRGVRDGHVNYIMAGPRGCYAGLLPLRFRPVWDDHGKLEFAISGLPNPNTDPELAQMTVGMAAGDRLVSYNGKSMKAAAQEIQDYLPWSTSSSKIMGTAYSLSIRDFRLMAPPNEDSAVMKLINKDGKVYDKQVPWIVRSLGCSDTPSAPAVSPTLISASRVDDGWKTTSENTLTYKMLNFNGKKVGIIKLTGLNATFYKPGSYYPDNGIIEFITTFRSVLTGDLASSDALIFDVRNARGGDSWIGSDVASFFTEERVFHHSQMRNNEFGKGIMAEMNDEKALKYAMFEEYKQYAFDNDKPFSKAVSVYPIEEVIKVKPELGLFKFPRYAKPVALYMNGHCSSGCELMVQLIRKAPNVKIMGETQTTGGLIANTWNHQILLTEDIVSKDLAARMGMKPLPGKLNFTVPLRRGVGGGPKPVVLEGRGVACDYFIPSVLDDLLDGGETRQYERVFRTLTE